MGTIAKEIVVLLCVQQIKNISKINATKDKNALTVFPADCIQGIIAPKGVIKTISAIQLPTKDAKIIANVIPACKILPK